MTRTKCVNHEKKGDNNDNIVSMQNQMVTSVILKWTISSAFFPNSWKLILLKNMCKTRMNLILYFTSISGRSRIFFRRRCTTKEWRNWQVTERNQILTANMKKALTSSLALLQHQQPTCFFSLFSRIPVALESHRLSQGSGCTSPAPSP